MQFLSFKEYFLKACIRSLFVLVVLPEIKGQSAASLMGSCGFNQGIVDVNTHNAIEAHHVLGLKQSRISVYPSFDVRTGNVIPEVLDDSVLLLHQQGINPMILLEHYFKTGGAPGSYKKWYAIGHDFAERFSPNSKWLLSNGIKDWGIKYYSIFNEPHNTFTIENYIQAVKGFADGVHSIDASLLVAPGGFMEVPLFTKTNKYMPELAKLYNNGTLDAIDIHRYYDRRNEYQIQFKKISHQTLIDDIKKEYGITKDIRVWCTEYNARGGNNEENAIDFVTATWDLLTVTNQRGKYLSDFALAYVSYMDVEGNKHLGMAVSKFPYLGVAKGKTHAMLAFITKGLKLSQSDTKKGIDILDGKEKKMWVWHNRKEWSSIRGSSFEIKNLPEYAKVIEVYRYDSWKMEEGCSGQPDPLKRINLNKGQQSIKIDGLDSGQTYMILASAKPLSVELPKLSFRDSNPNKKLEEGSSFDISVQSQDIDKIKEIVLYAGVERIGTKTKAPYTWTWNNIPAGHAIIRAIAKSHQQEITMITQEVTVAHKNEGITILPTDDSYIKGGSSKDNNYGKVTELPVKTSSNAKLKRKIVLKFNLKDVKDISSATLKMRVARSGQAKHILYHLDDDNWSEADITWANSPEFGEVVTQFEPVSEGYWTEIDITKHCQQELKSNRILSLGIWTQSNDHIQYYSKEAQNGNAPRIIINDK